jgi:DNA-binding MarR family transcriptional regulator
MEGERTPAGLGDAVRGTDAPHDPPHRDGDVPQDEFAEQVSRFWRNYMLGSNALRQKLGHELEQAFGVNISDYAVAFHLAEHPEHRMRMAQLADSICYTRSRTTQIVARMERSGYLERGAHDSDGRGVYAIITPRGLDMVKEATRTQRAVAQEYFLRFLDRDEVPRLGELFGEVIRSLSDFDCSGTAHEVFSRE